MSRILNVAVSANVNHVVDSLHAAADQDLIRRLSRWFSAPNTSSDLNLALKKR